MTRRRSRNNWYVWLPLLAVLFGCQMEDADRIDLNDGWQIARGSAADSLVFRPIQNISELTPVFPDGGIVFLPRQFDLPAELLEEPLALMLGRIVKADRTYLNGSFVGSTGQFPPGKTNHWNINRLYPVGREQVQAQGNELLVEIYFEPGRGGIFDTPMIGKRYPLEQYSRLRNFYYVETYKISFVVSFLAALFFFLVYTKRKQDRQFLYFSLSLLSFSVWSTYHFIWSVPYLSGFSFFDSLAFQKVLWIALFGYVYFCIAFIYEFLQRQRYAKQFRFIQILLGLFILGFIVAWSPQVLEQYRRLTLLGLFPMMGLSIYWMITAIREGVTYSRRIFGVYLIFVLLGIMDILIDV